ncbi:GNAT family N-acetyltransferase [Corynebacterium alimapuense]|uniref:GNAT family N-acetyltransferase n=1 Tax=Corynebacterium alimapuense TaxID=1576874 RepID=A0A3M8K8D3_9CORY|nr:GNAT family N-acetyltransferase [Corynebacterium alimapuense]RNE49497.1 GNAT family N-acetyltransferase [Corynebacterium alimapuense]
MTLEIRRLSGPEFAILCPRLVGVYIDAMNYDPAIRDSRTKVWRREIFQPGFTSLVALDQDEILGVAYGYLGTREMWWDRQIRRGIRQEGGPDTSQIELLRDYFEVAEIHVHPLHQSKGIGRILLSQLLWNAPGSNALLSTPEVDGESNLAFKLYRSMGFRDVLRHFIFDGDTRPFAVLSAPLPLPGMVNKPATSDHHPG